MVRALIGYGIAAFAIAVLPFANVNGDKEDEYFSDGMTDEINGAVAATYFNRRDYDRAIALAKRAIEIDPRVPSGIFMLEQAYQHTGRYTEALAVLDQAGNPPACSLS